MMVYLFKSGHIAITAVLHVASEVSQFHEATSERTSAEHIHVPRATITLRRHFSAHAVLIADGGQ